MKILNSETGEFIRLKLDVNSLISFNNKKTSLWLQKSFEEYMNSKKSTNIQLFDEDEDKIERDEYFFINFSDHFNGDSEKAIAPKSLICEYICAYMANNDEEFLSMQKINELKKDIRSDIGMYNLSKNLSFGLSQVVKINCKNIDPKLYTNFLELYAEDLDDLDVKIILSNIKILMNRDKKIVLWIEENNITNKLSDWIEAIGACSYINILILTNSIEKLHNNHFYYQHIFENEEIFEFLELSESEFDEYRYALFENTRLFQNMQKKEIVDIINEVNGIKNSLFIKKTLDTKPAQMP